MSRYLLIFCVLLLFLPQKVLASSLFTQIPDKTNIGIADEVSFSTNLSVSSADGTQYYLRGVFYQPGTNNYCGFTWNGSDWFSGPYSSNEGWKHFLPITIQSASWSGVLRVKIDPDDSGCKESGNYNFKIQRFTVSGSATIDEQNEVQFVITVPTPTIKPTATTPPTKAPSSTPLPTSTKTPTPPKSVASALESNISSSISISPSSAPTTARNVLGITSEHNSPTPSHAPLVMGSTSTVFNSWTLYVLGGIGLITGGCGILLFKEWKKQKSLEL